MSVDFFDAFGSQYGDEAAEACLRRVGEVLQRSLRGSIDFAARFDDEAFAVLLPGTSIENSSAVAERIRQRVEALWIPHDGSKVATHVTVSIGVASIAPAEGIAPASLIAEAVHALDAAKTVGGNRVATTEGAAALAV
jgi:two-component system, chemotaxis family, response regulator WspR